MHTKEHMRIFLTGGSGFIGSQVARLLRERGDEVVALARRPTAAAFLTALGCEVVNGDLTDLVALANGMHGVDAVVHGAARYELGVPKSELSVMHDNNCGGTRRVLGAAADCGVRKIIHVSTINVYGDTHGKIVDETYQRNRSHGFLSCYDETKYDAHQVALEMIHDGLPIAIAMPGVVYGPGDHAQVGKQLLAAATGGPRLNMLTNVGLSLVYVDDVARGIVAVLDKGEVGESYNLTGENTMLKDAMACCAQLAGKPAPQREVPVSVARALVPVSSWLLPKLGYPPNLAELIRATDGVTYWASHEKAANALGYSPRNLREGLQNLLTSSQIATV